MGRNEAGRAVPQNIGNKATLAGLIGLMMIQCGCSTVRVKTDYEHTANLVRYRTYAVEPPPNAPTLAPVADAALRTTLRDGLAARGVTEVTPGDNPDLAVIPHAKNETYSIEQNSELSPGPDVWLNTYNTFDPYTGGTVVLDFVDTSNQELVFRGTVRGTASIRPERNAEKMCVAVEKLVAKLPPRNKPGDMAAQ